MFWLCHCKLRIKQLKLNFFKLNVFIVKTVISHRAMKNLIVTLSLENQKSGLEEVWKKSWILSTKSVRTLNMAQDLPLAAARLDDIQTHTAKDDTLQVLTRVILDGCPKWGKPLRSKGSYSKVAQTWLAEADPCIPHWRGRVYTMSKRASIGQPCSVKWKISFWSATFAAQLITNSKRKTSFPMMSLTVHRPKWELICSSSTIPITW